MIAMMINVVVIVLDDDNFSDVFSSSLKHLSDFIPKKF